MRESELLLDLFSRVREHVTEAVEGLDVAALTTPPGAGTNTIGWLVWHLTRVEDAQVAEVMEAGQVWSAEWARRFGTDPGPGNHGYGHTWEQVLALRPESADALVEYHTAVAERTTAWLATLDAHALDRIVDTSYDPPVTLGVRLVSVVDDEIQHAGQAVYARGLLERQSSGQPS